MLITPARKLVSTAGLAVLLASVEAGAAEPEALSVEYVVPAPSCPEASRFTSEVEARLRRPVTWNGASWSKRLLVRVEEERDGVRAELTVETPDAAPALREFHMARCEDAIVALAIVAALAIDPNSADALATDASAAEAPAPEAAPPARPAPRPPARTRPRAPAVRPRSELTWSLGAGAAAALNAGPSPEPLTSGGAELSLDARAGSAVALAPRFGLGVHVGRSGVLAPGVGEAEFTWTVVRLSGCPLRLELGDHVTLRPCALADVGRSVVEGDPEAVAEPDTARRLWLSVGPATVLRAALERFFVDASFGVLATLSRPTYVFDNPTIIVHDVPSAAWTFGLVLGFTL